MSYAQWRNSYTRFLIHLVIIVIHVCAFTQVCLVELERCIFSVYVKIRYFV
jgi:hypothetical protein